MKKLLMLIAMVVMGFLAMAQTPTISYQAVVRDANNRLVTNDTVNVEVTIGAFTQTFNKKVTNANGLLSLQIGDASAAYKSIDWSTATITTTVTILRNSETITSTVPVTAVPYALKAAKGGLTPEDSAAIYSKIKADSLVLATRIYNDSVALAGHLNDTLSKYYTAEKINDTLSKYYTAAKINDTLSKYYTAAKINDTLSKYYTAEKINDTLSKYYTAAKINDTLSKYYTAAKINDTLSKYYTALKTDTLLGAKADTASVKAIAKKVAELTTALADTNDHIRAWADTTFATVDKLKQDSTVLHNALKDTALAIRTWTDTTFVKVDDLKNDTLILKSGTTILNTFISNAGAAAIEVDVKPKYTHEEEVDSVKNFISSSSVADWNTLFAALKGNTTVWPAFQDSTADAVMDYFKVEMMKDTASMTLLKRAIERFAVIAPTLGHDDAKYYLDRAKEIRALIPTPVKEDIRNEIKYRAKELLKSSQFQSEVTSILSDPDVKNAILNNAGIQSLINTYISNNITSIVSTLTSNPTALNQLVNAVVPVIAGNETAMTTLVTAICETPAVLNALVTNTYFQTAMKGQMCTLLNGLTIKIDGVSKTITCP